MCSHVARSKNIGIALDFAAVVCTSLDIRYFMFTSGSRPPFLIIRASWRRPVLTLVPLCCSMQTDMRIPLKFHIYSISNVRFKLFRFHVRNFDFRLNSHRIVHRAMLLSVVVTSVSSKTNAATLNLLSKVIYALRFNGHQVYHIFPNKSSTPPSLPVM